MNPDLLIIPQVPGISFTLGPLTLEDKTRVTELHLLSVQTACQRLGNDPI